jgi:tetratricopeptide (TPR) repeat protein
LACQGWFACRLSHFDTARERLEQAFAIVHDSSTGQELAFIHFAMGFLEVWSGRFKEAYFHLSTSLSISEQIGDTWSAAWARQVLAEGAYESGQSSASEPFQFSLSAFEHIGDKRGISRALNYLGIIALREGYFSQAQAYFERLLSYMERFGDVWGAAGGYGKLGQLAFVRGENERAWGLYQHSLQLLQKTGDQRRIAFLLAEMGEVSVNLGKQDGAEAFFAQALHLAIETNNLALAQHIMTSWSAACLQLNQPEKAAEFLHLVFAGPVSDRSTTERAAHLAEQLAHHQPEAQVGNSSAPVSVEALWTGIRALVDKTVKR